MIIVSCVIVIIINIVSVNGRLADSQTCGGDADCGWNSYCDHGQCWCKAGYQRSSDGSDCLDSTCSVEGCIQCLDNKLCKRCASYLVAGTGQCTDRCGTDYALMVEGDEIGRVCEGGEPGGMNMVYVAIIVAASAAVLLVILLALAIHFKIKTDKERDMRLKLMGELLDKRKQVKSTKESSQTTEWDCYSYDSSDEEFRLKRLHYYHQVATLKPQMDTFLAMLRDAKVKCHSLGPSDSRQLLYRNLIHQLCRVLTIINDRMAAMPSDGNLLLDWAQRVLTDYRRYQKPSPIHSSCWTLPNSFAPHHRLMNGSLPERINHTTHINPRSLTQPFEENREVSEISGLQLISDLTEPIEV